jgi:hypothetical protein
VWGESAGRGLSLKPCIKLSLAAIRSDLGVLLALDFNGDEFLAAIRSDLGVLLALDFNGDEFLCAIFWVLNGRRFSAGDVLLGEPSII